ncbi:ethanolamine ammonia-lyase subunit EutC [Spirosoma sp. KUDC1026]|uniref:ethanolamine ammonia-lyase subunit EutC n=1 Tax=Spirosoma sp. KUDC1026 TaxID=2745947 RepID=UPI00159BC358|nr:ethanolamine ammonia-lyase subunit EutC [Spirosoma sp. KUDC1026]QKZ15073.1 ethanolamine ammonia-lyase subunit EutC [Spirosoma sp. KUDC1026]
MSEATDRLDMSDPWAFLSQHTAARIAQGRTGHSLTTSALLHFQLDHARARDAVHAQLATDTLLTSLNALQADALLLHSQATDRQTYLKRPDLGRQLAYGSMIRLAELDKRPVVDLCIVIADGLSAFAIEQHVVPLLTSLLPLFRSQNWQVAPLCVVEQGRVAVGDEIAHAFGAELLLVLIGERPGLSSPDSLGAYLTYQARPGMTDELRNCVSNIRPEGYPYELAAQKLLYLLTEMKSRRLSGVALKDEMPTHRLGHTSSPAAIEQSPETPD